MQVQNHMQNLSGAVFADQMQTDWEKAFTIYKPGDVVPYVNGKITFGANGSALYTDAQGKNFPFSKTQSFDDIASRIPDIAKQWNIVYGYVPGDDVMTALPNTAVAGFDVKKLLTWGGLGLLAFKFLR